MTTGLLFEHERIQVKKLMHENGGLDTQALLPPLKGREVCGKYRDTNGRLCEISILLTHEGMDLAKAVRDAMLHPTVLR